MSAKLFLTSLLTGRQPVEDGTTDRGWRVDFRAPVQGEMRDFWFYPLSKEAGLQFEHQTTTMTSGYAIFCGRCPVDPSKPISCPHDLLADPAHPRSFPWTEVEFVRLVSTNG
jgi:hypothetical protein